MCLPRALCLKCGLLTDAPPPFLFQLLRAIGFLNKHGFAHLDIKRENIVLEPLHEDVTNLLFFPVLPLGQAAVLGAEYDKIAEAIQVSSTAATATPFQTLLQVRLIDFGHAAHVLHFARKIEDSKSPSLKDHCPKGYSAPEAGAFLLLPFVTVCMMCIRLCCSFYAACFLFFFYIHFLEIQPVTSPSPALNLTCSASAAACTCLRAGYILLTTSAARICDLRSVKSSWIKIFNSELPSSSSSLLIYLLHVPHRRSLVQFQGSP
jgi:serine/threonine protein kinase